MITSIITAAIAAATTTGVCLWAYRKGKADGASEAYREKSSMTSDFLHMVALGNLAGFGSNKSFIPSYCAPKDEAIDQFVNTLNEDELEKLINALKGNQASCNCKQEDSSKS